MYSPRPRYTASSSYGSITDDSPASSTMGTRTPRRLSVSNNAQWTTAQGRQSPAIMSGYALSLNENSSPQQPQQPPLPSSSSSSSLHRSPSTSSIHSRTIRQLDPVSIFQRLGLGEPTPAASMLTSSGTSSTYAGPSPGREDADLPSDQFEGIPDLATATPVPVSSSSSISDTPAIAFKHQSQSNAPTTSISTTSATRPSSQGEALLKLASVPPVDLVDPSVHPPHAIVVQYPQTSDNAEASSKIIPVNEDILLPFVERPKEVRELLEQEPRNIGLFNKLKEVFEPHPSTSNCSTPSLTSSNASLSHSISTTSSSSSGETTLPKYIWQDVESILYKSREELKDQEWIDKLKLLIFPRSTALWERLRACLGIDVDDEQGRDKFEELSYNNENDNYNALPASFVPPSSFQGGGHLQSSSSIGGGSQAASSGGGDVFSLISPPTIVPSPASNADMLSPRAILRTHGAGGVSSQHLQGLGSGYTTPNAINIPGMNSPSNGGNSNLKATQFYSPAGSTGVSPSPSPGPGSINPHSARQFDRTAAPGGDRSPSKTQPVNLNNPASTSSGASSVASSPGGGDSSRMHRRTSSGGSSFRRAFAMSSISEDAPVVDFSRDRSLNTGGTSSTSTTGPSTPSGLENQNSNPYNSIIAESPTPNRNQQQLGGISSGGGGFDLGNLLKSKGVTAIDDGGSSIPSSTTNTNAMNIPGMINTSHPSMQESALSTSSSSSFAPSSMAANSSNVSGHSISLGQANLSASSSSSSMLGLNMEVPSQHHYQQSQSPQISRSPSFSISSRINALSNLGGLSNSSSNTASGNAFPPMHSPSSFNATFNKRAYDEYNPVFESDDGSSVASSVRSTGRGPGMRRSFGQLDAMSPIRGPNPRIGGGGFALAGLNIGKTSSASVKDSSGGNTTPKP